MSPSPFQHFLPHAQVPLVAATVALTALPPDESLGCDAPDPALAADIAALGVLQPIILMEQGTGGYVVCDGRSRIRAARMAGLAVIPAMVAPEGHIAPSAIGAKANALRRDNPRTRLTFIEEAAAAGLDDQTICRVGGFSAAELKAARRFLDLIPVLRTALDTGTIRATVARAAAALTPAQQRTLLGSLHGTGRLRLTEVQAARRVARADAMATLPLDLVGTPDADAPDDWRAGTGHLLRAALALVPAGEPAARDAITAALVTIDASALDGWEQGPVDHGD